MIADRTVVVGGGVIGLSVAYQLALRGEDVIVLDSGEAGGACSRSNAGWVMPDTTAPLAEPGTTGYALRSLGRPTSPVYVKPRASPSLVSWLWRFWRASNRRSFEAGREALVVLGRDSVDLLREVHDRSPFVIGAERSLRVFGSLESAKDAADGLAFLNALSIETSHTVLSGDEARLQEPLLSKRVGGALLSRGDLQVEPWSLCRALVDAVRQLGGDVREGCAVTRLVTDASGVAAVETPRGEFRATRFVIAAGSWSPRLLRPLGTRLRMQVGKGYSFSVDLGRVPTAMIDIVQAKVGVAPIEDRARIVGTMELSGMNADLDPRRFKAMIKAAHPFLESWPADVVALADVGEPWLGLRPLLPDGLPVIDRVHCSNTYVSTGHAMLGISLGLSSGRALADFVLEGRKPARLEPFSLDRLRRR